MASSIAQSKRSEAARQRRQKMRAQGLREIRIWVPDTRLPTFAEEARRQSLAVANSPMAKDDQDFIDAVSARWDE